MSRDPSTQALHADRGIENLPDVAPPIRVSTTFSRSDQDALTYRRDQHPTRDRLEAVLGALEGGHAVVYPSGMAAITTLLDHLAPGQIFLPDDCYHGARAMIESKAAAGRWRIVARPDDLGAGDVWWVETPSNPKCLITDIRATAGTARARGVLTLVDSTFATPILQQPLALGADFVMHATTKFIGGHSDSMGGVIVTADPVVAERLRAERALQGYVPGPLDVWLALRGVRTLPIRVERQVATAGEVAAFLSTTVGRVWYPGLPSHPGHEIAAGQMSGFGSMVSFELEDEATARSAVDALQLITQATSLGGVETLAEHRYQVNPAAPPGLIRLSIGLEAAADLIGDLSRALDESEA